MSSASELVSDLSAELTAITSGVATSDPVTVALGELESLRQKTQEVLDELDRTTGNEAVQASLRDVLDAVFDARTKLNQQAIEDHTISLQAAEEQLDPGIGKLKGLRDQLAEVAHTITEVSEVVAAADSAISGVRAVLASFGA